MLEYYFLVYQGKTDRCARVAFQECIQKTYARIPDKDTSFYPYGSTRKRSNVKYEGR